MMVSQAQYDENNGRAIFDKNLLCGGITKLCLFVFT
jgi:hypothetical protein